MQERRFRAGETIFSEGDPSDEAFIICDGRVEILKCAPDDSIKRLAVIGERDVFGEMGLLDELPRSATARACDDVLAVAINRNEFLNLLTEEPEYGLTLLRALFERLREANRRYVDEGAGQSIRESVPEIRLVPVSEAARTCMPADGIFVNRFPFRIGRERGPGEPEVLTQNDLRLPDRPPFTVSLNHLSIDLDATGVVVRDRGSYHGASVNGTLIGTKAGLDYTPLKAGENDLTLSPENPNAEGLDPVYSFQILVR